MDLKRNASGTYLTIKSDLDFDTHKEGSNHTFATSSMKYKPFTVDFTQPFVGKAKFNPALRLFTQSGQKLNASFLQVNGLKDGKTFKIQGVVSVEMMKKFDKEFRALVRDIYKQFYKADNVSSVMSVTETETL